MAKKVSPRKSATGKAGKASVGGAAGARAKTVGKAAATPVAKGTKGVKPARKSGANKPAKSPAKVAKAAKPVKNPAKAAKPAKRPTKSPAKGSKFSKPAGRTPAKSPLSAKASRTDHPPLTKEELKEFRQLLLAKRRELVGDMAGIEAEALGADRQESKGDISDHPADAGTDNFEQEFSLGLLESERNMLADIDKALIRLEKGTYGVCLGTGRPIAKARLVARPWAPYGIEYARMVEKGLVRAGDKIVEDEEPEEEDDDAESDADGEVEHDYEPEDREADHDDEEPRYGE